MKSTIISLVGVILILTASMPAQTTIATLPVGLSPHSLAMSPNGDVAYVVNRDSNDVSVIDLASLEVINTIPVGDRPEGVAFSPEGLFAYVANDRSEDISMIYVPSGEVIFNFFIQDPQGIAVTSDGMFAYVTQSGRGGKRNSVSIMDLSTGVIFITMADIQPRPRAVILTFDDTLAYVLCRESNSITAIRKGAVTGTISVGQGPREVAFYLGGLLAFVTNHDSNTISLIDPATDTVFYDFTEILHPEGIALTTDGLYAVIAGGQPGNFLYLLDLATFQIIGQAPVGQNPEKVALTPDNLFALVANRGSNTVSVVQLFKP